MNSPIQIERANYRRAIGAIEALSAKADNSERDYFLLCAYDALGNAFPELADALADRMADIRHDIGLDEEGYPLTDEGDLDIRADRVWIPVARIQGGMAA